MLLLQSVGIILLLVVCAFAPGFWIVRRLPWNPLEKLCGSVALSLVLLWLAAWTIYVLGLPSMAYYAVTAACVVLAAISLRDLRALRVRHALAGFALLFAWTLVALSIIRVYNGARWGGDWLEHFQRTLFFLHHFPTSTEIFGNYQLPARPPAENVLAAFFLGQVADRFELFQIVFAFLNLLVFLPCCLALPLLARSRRFGIAPLMGVFATSPIIMQNATYTWTKLLAAFFIIFALVLYLKGWRRNDTTRIVAAFVCLAMGMLVHYSAGPYIVFFALHYLIVVFRKRLAWKELAIIATACGMLLATWFGWSIATYGLNATAASNTSITASQDYKGSNLAKIAGNIVDSFIPHLLRDSALRQFFDQPNRTAALRDNVFIAYQVQLLLTMGIIGGPLVAWLVVSSLRNRTLRRPERRFWIWLIASSIFIGIAVVGERDMFGSAHLTLLPMEVLGLTLLAARFRQTRTIAMLIIAGCAVDFGLGVFLHLNIQHMENTAADTPFSRPVVINRQVALVPAPDSLSDSAWQNWSLKHELANGLQWKRDLEGADAVPAGKAEALAMIDKMIASDARVFRGWYARHGGELEYLGDHFGDTALTQAVLAALCLALLYRMAQQIPRPAPVPVPVKTKSARVRTKR